MGGFLPASSDLKKILSGGKIWVSRMGSHIVKLSTGTCTFIRSRPEKKDFPGPVNIYTLFKVAGKEHREHKDM